MLNKMLQIFALKAKDAKLEYWINTSTLLLGAYGLQKDMYVANICILDKDEYNLLDLQYELSNYSMKMESLIGGYRISYNSTFMPIVADDNYLIEQNESSVPYINIIITTMENNIIKYNNTFLADKYPNHFIKKNNLYPLKYYNVNGIKMYGPNDPIEYINRIYKYK